VNDTEQTISKPLASVKKTRWAWWLATWFGCGYMAPGPGTYGSVAAVVLWLLGSRLAATPGTVSAFTLAAAVLVTLAGIRVSTIVARESGRKDPGFVVIDEVAGQWLALVPLTPTLAHALLGLVLFRLFDITKWPPVIRRLEALPEGTGIMLDDVCAGLFAAICGAAIVGVAHHFHLT
jgi:phosphatidylglycerophosphatase A